MGAASSRDDGGSRLSVASGVGARGAKLPFTSKCPEGEVGDSQEACPQTLFGQVIECVVAKAEGRSAADPAKYLAALTRLLPCDEAVHQLLQLATLDQEPYKREIQAAFDRSGTIPALAASLADGATPQAQQQSAVALSLLASGSPERRRIAVNAVEETLALHDCRLGFDRFGGVGSPGACDDEDSCSIGGNSRELGRFGCASGETLETVAKHMNSDNDMCCTALALLREAGLCPADRALDLLVSLAESRPADLELQCRTSAALRRLTHAGALDAATAQRRNPGVAPLLSAEWLQLLARFQGSHAEGERLQNSFHSGVQAMFHEEIARRFEYEAAERSLHLQQCQTSGARRLQEVVRCFVENVEDYQSRLSVRDFAWDPEVERLVRLDSRLHLQLCADISRRLEPCLISALKVAASSAPRTPQRRRKTRLRSECTVLLDLKTEVTEAHEEHAAQLRREVILFDILEYLELHLPEVSEAQIHTVFSMLHVVEGEPSTPIGAAAQLRKRLDRVAGNLLPSVEV